MILTINIQKAAVKMYSIKAKGILKISHRYAKKKKPFDDYFNSQAKYIMHSIMACIIFKHYILYKNCWQFLSPNKPLAIGHAIA